MNVATTHRMQVSAHYLQHGLSLQLYYMLSDVQVFLEGSKGPAHFNAPFLRTKKLQRLILGLVIPFHYVCICIRIGVINNAIN